MSERVREREREREREGGRERGREREREREGERERERECVCTHNKMKANATTYYTESDPIKAPPPDSQELSPKYTLLLPRRYYITLQKSCPVLYGATSCHHYTEAQAFC